jgi:Methyltransferase domain
MDPVANSRTWARVFAAIYDPSLWIGERAGMRRYRQELLIRARGRTLEIGSGTGLNLAHYPDDVDDLVLAEPDPSMRKRLETAVRRSEHTARVIDTHAEQLPFADSPTLARWQDRRARPWQRFAGGCRCNRATLELMDACGFQLEARPTAWRAMPPIIRPLTIGRATIAATRGQEA